MTLAEALEAAVRDLPDVVARQTGGGTEWSVGEQAFAAVSGTTAEFRLGRAVAGAALGTSDTRASARREGWVAFSPPELDRFAVDRAQAWLSSAYRAAVGDR